MRMLFVGIAGARIFKKDMERIDLWEENKVGLVSYLTSS